MKKINFKKHMNLDYIVLATFSIATIVMDLNVIAVVFSVALALVHSFVTILTFVPENSIISPKLHGWIEFSVAPVIASMPWALGFTNNISSQVLFYGLGMCLFLVWAITDYESEY